MSFRGRIAVMKLSGKVEKARFLQRQNNQIRPKRIAFVANT